MGGPMRAAGKMALRVVNGEKTRLPKVKKAYDDIRNQRKKSNLMIFIRKPSISL
jgi:hypothetical protein